MKIELTDTPFLPPAEIGQLASSLDALHGKVLWKIERLQEEIDTRKRIAAERWKNIELSMAERNRFAEKETLAIVRQIKEAAADEIDAFYKQAGSLYNPLMAQKSYYDSPVKVLARATLGDDRRTAYLHQLSFAGPAELAHFGQLAVGTQNPALAAAVLSRLDALPTKDRPFTPHALAAAMQLEAYSKVQQYFHIGETRLQGIIMAIRTWKTGRSNPINTLSLAMRTQKLDESVLKDLEEQEEERQREEYSADSGSDEWVEDDD